MKTLTEYRQQAQERAPEGVEITEVCLRESDSGFRTAVIFAETDYARANQSDDTIDLASDDRREWSTMVEHAASRAIAAVLIKDKTAIAQADELPYFEVCDEHPDAGMRLREHINDDGNRVRQVVCEQCGGYLGAREVAS